MIELKTITLPDGRTLTYELVRKRVKNVNFRAKDDGIIYVSANSRVSVKEVERFLTERADFFFGAFERLRAREKRSEINTETVNWSGEEYPVRIIHNARECAVLDEIECRVFTRLGSDGEYVLSLIQRAVADRFAALCRELNEEVRAELVRRGLTPPPTQITIKDMKSRWGSCSYTRGHISINIRLAAYPRETVLSVFWHEYAHYWHHDHSQRFYDFLLDMYPDYFRWNDLLKEKHTSPEVSEEV
ncbi:MAG: M48 family metallopeptidase [Ruminococcaceae bacterium]|nr:M48 family metallopeptidase [Oscillospiraceae bacterium]